MSEEKKGENDPVYQYNIGVSYSIGSEGRHRNYNKAAAWYAAAASQGYAPAIVALGELYENGDGVEQDYQKAFNLYFSAYEKRYVPAFFAIGNFYDKRAKDYKTAATWYNIAAENNNTPAMVALGKLYETGRVSDKSYNDARQIYEKAHNLGDKTATLNLGYMYMAGLGDGVDRNYEKAAKYFTEAGRPRLAADANAALEKLSASLQEGGYKKRKSNRPRIRARARKHKHKWSLKYKRSIDCKHPKGFSQRQHCKYGRKTMRKLSRKK